MKRPVLLLWGFFKAEMKHCDIFNEREYLLLKTKPPYNSIQIHKLSLN